MHVADGLLVYVKILCFFRTQLASYDHATVLSIEIG